jgi:hypothetical protein
VSNLGCATVLTYAGTEHWVDATKPVHQDFAVAVGPEGELAVAYLAKPRRGRQKVEQYVVVLPEQLAAARRRAVASRQEEQKQYPDPTTMPDRLVVRLMQPPIIDVVLPHDIPRARGGGQSRGESRIDSLSLHHRPDWLMTDQLRRVDDSRIVQSLDIGGQPILVHLRYPTGRRVANWPGRVARVGVLAPAVVFDMATSPVQAVALYFFLDMFSDIGN